MNPPTKLIQHQSEPAPFQSRYEMLRDFPFAMLQYAYLGTKVLKLYNVEFINDNKSGSHFFYRSILPAFIAKSANLQVTSHLKQSPDLHQT